MIVNGGLEFDASAASEIKRLRLEKVTSVPTHTPADQGRLLYSTTSSVIYVGGASSWTAIATGGDASSVQAELDTLELALGTCINADGTFNAAAFTGDLSNLTTVTAVIQALQSLVTANTVAIGNEATRATEAEADLQAAIDAEIGRAEGVEQSLQDALEAEIDRATAAETTIAGNLTDEINRATGAEGTLTTNLANEISRATAAEGALDSRIDALEAGSAGGKYFLYNGSANTVHLVDHNLGRKYCTVTVIDTNDDMILPQSIKFNTTTRLTVTFNSSTACKVVVMAAGDD